MRIDARIVLVALAFLAFPTIASAWPPEAEQKDKAPAVTSADPDELRALDAQVSQNYAQIELLIFKADFAAAREKCADCTDLLTRRYGAEHWRVVTAVVLEKSCAKAAQLTAAERERLRWAALTFRLSAKAADSDPREALRYLKAASQTTEELLGEYDLFSTRFNESCPAQPREIYAICLAVSEKNPEQSREMLQRILAIRKQSVGTEHPLYASALQYLAYANGKLQNCKEAAAQFQDAKRIYARTYGSESREVASCQSFQLVTLVNCRKFAEAEELAKLVLKRSADFRSEDPGIHVRAQIHQARALHGSRKLDASLAAFEGIARILENASERPGPHILIEFYEFYVAALDDAGRKADAASIRQRISILQQQQAKRRDEAEPGEDLLELPPAETSSPRVSEHVGQASDHITRASARIEPHIAQGVLAFPLHASGGTDTVAQDKSPEAELTAADPDGPTAMDAQIEQIQTETEGLIEKGDYAAAREKYASSIELITRRYGAGQWQVSNAAAHEKSFAKLAQLTIEEQTRFRRARLASKMGLDGKSGDPLRSFETAWQTMEKLLGEDDLLSTRPKEYYALFLVLTKPEESREILERVLEIRRQLLGAEHPLCASALQHLAYANGMLQNLDKAVEQFQQAKQIYLSECGSGSPEIAFCQLYQLMTLVNCRKFDEAEALAEPALKLSAKLQDEEPWLNTRIRIHHARALHGNGKLEAALPAFKRIADFIDSKPRGKGASCEFQIGFYEYYVAALDDAGQEADAANIRQRIAKLQKQLAERRGEAGPGDDVLEPPPAEGQ